MLVPVVEVGQGSLAVLEPVPEKILEWFVEADFVVSGPELEETPVQSVVEIGFGENLDYFESLVPRLFVAVFGRTMAQLAAVKNLDF